jgi:hypothetical protein
MSDFPEVPKVAVGGSASGSGTKPRTRTSPLIKLKKKLLRKTIQKFQKPTTPITANVVYPNAGQGWTPVIQNPGNPVGTFIPFPIGNNSDKFDELLEMVKNVALQVRSQGAEMESLREERDQWKSRENTPKGKEPEVEEEFSSEELEEIPPPRAEPRRVEVDTHTTPLDQKLNRAQTQKEINEESPTFFWDRQSLIPDDSPFRPLKTGNKELDELVSPTVGSPSPSKGGLGGKLPNVALPRFSGAPGALQKWAVEFQRWLRMTSNQHQDDTWKLDWFVEACSDKVRERVEKLARNSFSFAEILVKLQELTPVMTNSVTVKEEIEAIPRLKSPTPSATEIEDLIFSFEYTLDKLPEDSMSTEDILLKFMTKIHPDQLTTLRRDNLVAHNLHSLGKMKALLRKVAANEELLLYLEKQSRKGALETPQRTPKNPTNEPEKALLGNEVPEGTCFNCEEPGHFARDCPQGKKPEGQKQGYIQTSMTCEKCHRKNHIKVNCFWNPDNPNNKIAEFEKRAAARKAREAANPVSTPAKPETPNTAPKEEPKDVEMEEGAEVVEVKEPKDSNKKRKRALLAKALVNTQG